MSGRFLKYLCLGLLTTSVGCTRTLPVVSTSQSPPNKGDEETITHKASTYTAFADYKVASAAAPEVPSAAKQLMREEARLSYLKAIEVDSKYVPAYLSLARLLQQLNDYPSALKQYEVALTINPKEPAVWYDLGMCQCRLKQFTEAITSLQKACDLSPGNMAFRTTLGYTLGRAGRLQESLQVLIQAEGEAKAHFDLARLMHHLNQPQVARELVTIARSKDPSLQGLEEFLHQLNGQPASQPRTAPGTIQPAVAVQSVEPTATSQTMPQILQASAVGVEPPPDIPSTSIGSVTAEPAIKSVPLPPLPVIKQGSK